MLANLIKATVVVSGYSSTVSTVLQRHGKSWSCVMVCVQCRVYSVQLITTVELARTELAHRTRAVVARGILPFPDPDPGRCQAFRSAGSSKIKIRTSPWHKDKSALCHGEVRILVFDGPAELEA
jgi:hypothetical protein